MSEAAAETETKQPDPPAVKEPETLRPKNELQPIDEDKVDVWNGKSPLMLELEERERLTKEATENIRQQVLPEDDKAEEKPVPAEGEAEQEDPEDAESEKPEEGEEKEEVAAAPEGLDDAGVEAWNRMQSDRDKAADDLDKSRTFLNQIVDALTPGSEPADRPKNFQENLRFAIEISNPEGVTDPERLEFLARRVAKQLSAIEERLGYGDLYEFERKVDQDVQNGDISEEYGEKMKAERREEVARRQEGMKSEHERKQAEARRHLAQATLESVRASINKEFGGRSSAAKAANASAERLHKSFVDGGMSDDQASRAVRSWWEQEGRPATEASLKKTPAKKPPPPPSVDDRGVTSGAVDGAEILDRLPEIKTADDVSTHILFNPDLNENERDAVLALPKIKAFFGE